MTTKLIVIFSTIWIAPLMCWMLINETRFKKNIVLGVTLPQEAHEDPDVLTVLDRFKKTEILITVALCGSLLVCLLPQLDRWMMTVWMIWIDLCIFLPYIPYIKAHRRLMDIKAEKGWKKESRKIYVDTRAIGNERWISPVFFALPVLISALPFLFDRSSWPIYLINTVCCILLWFGYRYLYRNKAEMVDENTELTIALTRIRRYNWGKVWLLISWMMAAVSLIFLFGRQNGTLLIVLMTVLTVAVCVFALRIEMRMRKMQEKLTESSGAGAYIDDDDKWLGGFLYYNPDDHNAIINSRIGLNSTVNLASGFGKFMIVATVLLLLGMPFLGIALDQMSYQPISLKAEGNVLKAEAGWTDYEIDLESADSIELLEKLPKGLSRYWGTGTNKLLKGDFTADDYYRIKVMLDPTNGPWLLIHNADGYFLLGSREAGEITKLYQELTQ
ncbi:MAG: hypothetical protein IKF05_01385 [Erysipelotrichaceae bacterium]|nr:hypothetical protein [Erysipelotrichaceae bacterium]